MLVLKNGLFEVQKRFAVSKGVGRESRVNNFHFKGVLVESKLCFREFQVNFSKRDVRVSFPPFS